MIRDVPALSGDVAFDAQRGAAPDNLAPEVNLPVPDRLVAALAGTVAVLGVVEIASEHFSVGVVAAFVAALLVLLHRRLVDPPQVKATPPLPSTQAAGIAPPRPVVLGSNARPDGTSDALLSPSGPQQEDRDRRPAREPHLSPSIEVERRTRLVDVSGVYVGPDVIVLPTPLVRQATALTVAFGTGIVIGLALGRSQRLGRYALIAGAAAPSD